VTTPTHDLDVRPGEPIPTIAADLCAVRSCGESAEHFGEMGARLEGGYSRPAVDVALQVPLCFEHAALTKDGLTVKSWTPPALG